uniref:Uncharacterized protein n=1 Tax=Triticum urartu TaxID=4572 RepID=A0A8R7PKV9_TRIUA
MLYHPMDSSFLDFILFSSSGMEWHVGSYPPWAHRPGYIVSQDIGNTKEMFKLENVLQWDEERRL